MLYIHVLSFVLGLAESSRAVCSSVGGFEAVQSSLLQKDFALNVELQNIYPDSLR